MDLADRQRLKGDLDRVDAALRKQRRVLVHGPTGSGRGEMFAALQKRKDTIAVDVPPLVDADAPIHPALAAAAQIDKKAVEGVRDGKSITERVGSLARRIHKEKLTLVLRLPASWHGLTPRADADPEARLVAERARAVLAALTESDIKRIVIVTGGWFDHDAFDHVGLLAMSVRVRHVSDLPGWGTYAEPSRAVARKAHEAKLEEMTPVQYRLAVGLVGLGESPARVVDDVRYGGTIASSLELLEKRLVSALRRQRPVGAAVARFALARFGLPRAKALELSRIDREHEPLLTECLAYGGATLHVHDRLRTALATLRTELLPNDDAEATHRAIALHHRALDGTPTLAASPSPADWLERAFHLGLSGRTASQDWAELDLPTREHYWARGRALSLAGHYDEAAEVYKKCGSLYEDDDYAAHYEAYNRDHAGIGDARTEKRYRDAIEISPSNAWWNARLVTFLIDRGRFIAAREEWARAVQRVDPEGDGDSWLAHHFHGWIVRAWLDQGEIELARQAFGAIANESVLDDVGLRELARRLGDAEEAQRMGHSVYPATIPLAERWRAPRGLPAHSSRGARRVRWYPARVVEADDVRVLVALGIPPEGPTDQPRCALKEFDVATWRTAARTTDPPEGFWQLGAYADDEVQAVAVVAPTEAEPPPGPDPLRFMKRWADQTT